MQRPGGPAERLAADGAPGHIAPALGPDPLRDVVEILSAHSAQVRCPHGINAVLRARSRQRRGTRLFRSNVPARARPGAPARRRRCGQLRPSTSYDQSPPKGRTRNAYAPPASSPLTRALLLRTVAKLCQAPQVLRHCTSKLCAEPCSHANVTSVAATLSILRPRSVRPARVAAGRAQRALTVARPGAPAPARFSRP